MKNNYIPTDLLNKYNNILFNLRHKNYELYLSLNRKYFKHESILPNPIYKFKDIIEFGKYCEKFVSVS